MGGVVGVTVSVGVVAGVVVAVVPPFFGVVGVVLPVERDLELDEPEEELE